MSVKELKNSISTTCYSFIDKYRVDLLAISIGIIYLWFGALKLFPNWSPAEGIATETLSALVFHSISKQFLLVALGLVEVGIGIALILRNVSRFLKYVVFMHMLGTLLPLFIFPEITFNKPPFGFSIVGQYILKNIVIVSGLLIVFSKKTNT